MVENVLPSIIPGELGLTYYSLQYAQNGTYSSRRRIADAATSLLSRSQQATHAGEPVRALDEEQRQRSQGKVPTKKDLLLEVPIRVRLERMHITDYARYASATHESGLQTSQLRHLLAYHLVHPIPPTPVS